MPRAVVERMEPEAIDLIGSGASDDLIAAASTAISLKRIADALAPPTGPGAIDKLNEVLTDFANNLYSTLINART